MTHDELLARRLAAHHLSVSASAVQPARDLCGIQAQFLSNALHALRIRSADFTSEQARALLVKNWTLRGTVHIFSPDDLPLLLPCGEHYRSNVWDAPSFWNQRPDWALSPARQAELTAVIMDALDAAPQTRDALKARCRACGMTPDEEASMFHPWGGGLRELCERGFANYVVCEEKTLTSCPPFTPLSREDAALALARRYFTHYAPATVHDAMYFFHAPAREVTRCLSQLPVTSFTLDGRTYFSLGGAPSNVPDIPDCVFLAGFDPFVLGYEKKESLILSPAHLRRVFSLAGIISPSILLHGQLRAVWTRKGRSLSVTPFEPLSDCGKRQICRAAESLWPDCGVRFCD